MTQPFGRTYVQNYDSLYREKDYQGETDLIARLIHTYSAKTAARILDLGCGTGTHAIALARRGHEVIGVDRSPWMLDEARRKLAREPGLTVSVQQGDLRDTDLHQQFDAVVMMFAVLGYQEDDADVMAAMGAARRHLAPGGLFIFDCWFGPAVIHHRPDARVKSVPVTGGHIRRSAESTLDLDRHLCTVRFHVEHRAGDAVVSATDEEHRVRYFFGDELERFLTATGFTLLRLGAFPDFEQEPDDSTWNVLAVARAG